MPRYLLNNITASGNGQCTGPKCDLAINKNISYCGTYSCPKGFGVFEQNNQCYKYECPNGSTRGQDGKCYELKCPGNTIEQGDGSCK
jgi:hypothetical protein